jgi:hypothetical protein
VLWTGTLILWAVPSPVHRGLLRPTAAGPAPARLDHSTRVARPVCSSGKQGLPRAAKAAVERLKVQAGTGEPKALAVMLPGGAPP